MSGEAKGSNQRETQAGMCRTGAQAWLQQDKARQASEASAGRETTREEKRGETEEKRKDTNTENAEFDTIVCWRETKKPNPQARLLNLQTVTASRFAFNAQHDRRGVVVGRERVSGKKW